MILDFEALKAIDNWSWLVYFVSLSVLFYIFWRKKTISSSLIAVLITTVITFFMNEYRDFLLTEIADKSNVEQHKTLIRYAWYYGFTAFNVVLIIAIYKSHVTLKLAYSYTTRYILTSHFAMSLLQITRCLERQSFHTDYLALLYQWGIVVINLSCTIIVLFMALVALHKTRHFEMTRGVL